MKNSDVIQRREGIASRYIKNNLILINQRRAEAWVSGGPSVDLWRLLRTPCSRQELIAQLSKDTEKQANTITTINSLIHAYWLRDMLLINDRGPTKENVDAARLPEAHNKSGYLATVALAIEAITHCTFDLLVPCNLRCRHCYLDFARKDIMPLGRAKQYFNQLAEMGCVSISLTGGEIFLRKDILDVIDAALEDGFLVDLLTNGMYITDEMADALQLRHIQEVQISVYGTTADIHEATTRQPGSFKRSIDAAKRLVSRGIRVRLAMMVQKDNYRDAFRFSDFAQSIGARAQFDTKLVPTRDGRIAPLNYGISVQQLAELYSAGIIKKELGYECSAAVAKLRITADGEVYPCEIINSVSMGNLSETTISEIWAASSRRKLRADILGFKPHRCGSCTQVSDCEPCAAMRGYGYEDAADAEISEACLMTTAGILASNSNSDKKAQSMRHITDVYTRSKQGDLHKTFNGSLVQIIGVRT